MINLFEYRQLKRLRRLFNTSQTWILLRQWKWPSKANKSENLVNYMPFLSDTDKEYLHLMLRIGNDDFHRTHIGLLPFYNREAVLRTIVGYILSRKAGVSFTRAAAAIRKMNETMKTSSTSIAQFERTLRNIHAQEQEK